MEKAVYFFLAQKGRELPKEGDCVTCKGDITIAEFKKEVYKANKSKLKDARVDASNLEVFECGKNGARCQWDAKLSACTSWIQDKPFRIFYEGT